MFEIHLNSVFSSKSIDEIKLLSLYYDKIHIIDDATFSVGYDEDTNKFKAIRHSFVPEFFKEEYRILIEEGVIEISEGIDDNEFSKEISQTINKCENIIFPIHSSGNRILTSEVMNILTDVKKSKIDIESIDRDFIWWYYAKKLQRSVKTLLNGVTCISSSECMDKILNEYIKTNQEKFNENPLFNSSKVHINSVKNDISLSLPTPKGVSFEDILFLKRELHDERIAFQHELVRIQKKAVEADVTQAELQNFMYENIESPLKDLKGKIAGLKRSSLRGFIKNLQNPLAYSPLIGTFASNLPLQVTAGLSLGLITIDTVLKFIEENENIQKSALNFLLKI